MSVYVPPTAGYGCVPNASIAEKLFSAADCTVGYLRQTASGNVSAP